MKEQCSSLLGVIVLIGLMGNRGPLYGASFSGSSEGRFLNPLGPAEMLVEGVGNSQLDWGRIRPGSEVPSYFRIDPMVFSIEEGEPFVVGSFEYSNGENAIGSIPESVDLEILVRFDDGTEVSFLFPVLLGSTTNDENLESSADSVTFGRLVAENEILVNDERFVFGLKFGRTSSEGFSLADQFSVFESQVASAELVATISRVEVFDGRSAGVFDNPVGPEGKVTAGEGTDTFTWGEPPPGADPNRFYFEPLVFQARTSAPSAIGRFEYFNGSVLTGTAAETLDFMLLLEFPGSALRSFRFPLAIISTANSDDREASADIVQLLMPLSERHVVVNGREFEVELSFDNASEGGFTKRDRFFVFEDSVAAADLQVTLREILPEPQPDLDLQITTAVEVAFQTFPGGTYQIQSSMDLLEWTDEGDPVLGDGRKFRQFFSAPASSTRVFRIIEIE